MAGRDLERESQLQELVRRDPPGSPRWVVALLLAAAILLVDRIVL